MGQISRRNVIAGSGVAAAGLACSIAPLGAAEPFNGLGPFEATPRIDSWRNISLFSHADLASEVLTSGVKVRTHTPYGLKTVPRKEIAIAIGRSPGNTEERVYSLAPQMMRMFATRLLEMCDEVDPISATERLHRFVEGLKVRFNSVDGQSQATTACGAPYVALAGAHIKPEGESVGQTYLTEHAAVEAWIEGFWRYAAGQEGTLHWRERPTISATDDGRHYVYGRFVVT